MVTSRIQYKLNSKNWRLLFLCYVFFNLNLNFKEIKIGNYVTQKMCNIVSNLNFQFL